MSSNHFGVSNELMETPKTINQIINLNFTIMDKCYVITKKVEYLSENLHYDPEFHVLCVFNNLYSAKNHLLKLSKACSKNAEWSEYGDYFRYKLQHVAVYGSDVFPREDAEITVSLKQIDYMPN